MVAVEADGVVDRLRVVFVVTDYFSCARRPGRRRSRPHHDTGCHSRRDGNMDMTSVRTINPDQVDESYSAARGCSVRLSLKPSSAARGALDGAWWPRSTDPASELVALCEEFGVRRATVYRIGLNMAGWDSVPRPPDSFQRKDNLGRPRRIWLSSGRRVAVDWFRISGGPLVRILGSDNQWSDLLLIPADTPPASAELALTMATDGHDPQITTPDGHHSALVHAPEDA